jgi:hypothetical protein
VASLQVLNMQWNSRTDSPFHREPDEPCASGSLLQQPHRENTARNGQPDGTGSG